MSLLLIKGTVGPQHESSELGTSEHGSCGKVTYDSGHRLLYGGKCRDTPVHRPRVHQREEQHFDSCAVKGHD